MQASPGQPTPLHRLAQVSVTLSPVLHCTDNTRDGKVVGPAGTPGQVLLSWLYSALLCCAGLQPTDPECEQGGRGPVQLQVGPAHCSVVLTPSLCRAENRAAVRETPPVTLGVHGQLQLKATLHFGF